VKGPEGRTPGGPLNRHCAPPWVRVLHVLLWAGLAVRLALPGAASGAAADPSRALRLLQQECFACHGEEKKKGGLLMTSRDALLKGGDEGVVVAPGHPERSRLLQLLAAEADPHMPPKKQLTAEQVAILREWIQGGLAWNASALASDEEIQPVALTSLPSSYHPVLALALSPDGTRLAIGRGGRIAVHDLTQTNRPVLAEWQGHIDAVQSLVWTRTNRWLISGSFRRVVMWNGASFAPEHEVTHGLAGRITALALAPTEDAVAVGDSVAGRAGFIRLLNLSEARVVRAWKAHPDTVFAMDFSRDGRQLVTGGGDRLIKIWDVASGTERVRLEGHSAQVLGVAFNTNATQVVSGGADKQLKVWDIATREKIVALGNHTVPLNAVAWPGQGQHIVAVTDSGVGFRYSKLKPHTGEQSSATADERRLGDLAQPAAALAVSEDAKSVFAGGHDGIVQLWNEDGKLQATLRDTDALTNAVTRPVATAATIVTNVPPSESAALVQLASLPSVTKPSTGLAAGKPFVRQAPVPNGGALRALTVEPASLHFSPGLKRTGFRVTALTEEGLAYDVTSEARYSSSRPSPFEISSEGEAWATEPGRGTFTAHYGGKRVTVPVTVAEAFVAEAAPAPASFVRDVLPALSRAGCNAGACHAKPEGQNGFKLSVFSYDPKSDYHEIVMKARGRRVFPAAPDESLLLQKPLTRVPHEGGLRFEPGSETHQLLVRWMREGMAYTLTNEPALEHISVFPKERRYPKGARQRLLVRAHYTDGSVRDVTRLAAFAENDKEMAKVDEQGVVRIGTLTGQGVVVARYMGFVADAQLLVPAERVLPAERYEALPRRNFIDELAYEHFQQLGLFPSDTCSDSEFLRRAKLDALGVLPSPAEVRAFLADTSPDKRRRFIQRVLEEPSYADYWANKWADLLRPNPDRVGVKSVFTLDQWLRGSFRQNKPYDQFVREILLAEGSNHRDGPAVIYRDRREPPELTTMFSQLFLGTRLECAKCHHHPNEKWSQDDFYQLAAYFGGLKQKGAGLSPPISAGTETFYFSPGGTVKHPVTGAMMKPHPPDGPDMSPTDEVDPRQALADWLTAAGNPFFAKAAVNRVWASFFGRGLVEPVDDFRASNPCVNPPLLAALADDFARHGYDLKHLMRTILESQLYQLSSTPNEWNLADTRNFSRAYRRRLPAEVMSDAVSEVTGVPETFAAMPAGARAMQTWSYKIQSHFLDAFGRPNSSSDCPCERDQQMSVVQSLHLMNAKGIQARLADPDGHARRLAESASSPQDVVTEIYLRALSRFPLTDELAVAVAAFTAPGATRRSATEDVFWALLNSPEFVLNH